MLSATGDVGKLPDVNFVNRRDEVRALEGWWSKRGPGLAFVWGRRRVGKTALLQQFAGGKRAIFHTGSRRPSGDELRALSQAAKDFIAARDVGINPFHDWVDAFETLSAAARRKPILLVLDEFPELVAIAPELPSVIRAVWDRIGFDSKLRLLLCGSAVRTMEAMREERAPLYGRIDLALQIHPFRPHEAAAMLPKLKPSERALVWGIVGGIPLYLRWWDQRASVRDNLMRLACVPGAPLLSEGQLVLATEGEAGDLSHQVLSAVATGRTKHNEIADAIHADPTRTLDRLVDLRLIERLAPVTEDPARTRRRIYRIADNFLAFWLGVLNQHRPEIERGLGKTILSVLIQELDGFMGPRWEEGFRAHLRRMAAEGSLGEGVVAIGPYWTAAEDPQEIDAVVLAGRSREAVLAGEARWARMVDGPRVAEGLRRKLNALPRTRGDIRLAVCARESIRNPRGLLGITAAEIFKP